ncbi:MAG TPA: autorepressor SdpR family transcription factor [Gemmatimonadales bacterium]|jgi:DNA-binding transcriptional ArsR family regulator
MSRDGVFKALADPTRREILERLAQADLTAGEIAERFPMAFASVSHHLGVLKDAGLVAAEREGQFIRYRLNTTVYQDAVRYLMNVVKGGRRRA